MRRRRRLLVAIGSTLLVLVTAAGILLFRPADVGGLSSRVRPAASYSEALDRLGALEAQDGPEVSPLCRTQAKLHGQTTARAIVLIHGFTSCPQMWHELSTTFYDLGYNVLMARVPHHGLADRLTNDLQKLTAEELVSYSDQVVDIADGLGRQVVVAGISAGGVMTAWLAENRSDVYEAVVVNPALTAPMVSGELTLPVANVLLTLPNQFSWWDGNAKEKVPGPPYAYPRYSTHALGEVFRLGLAVEARSHSKPAAGHVVVITAEADPGTSNSFTDQIVENWKGAALTALTTYRFPASEITFHDILTPEQPYQKTALVYPKLIELTTQN